jgi:valyl-tRNA synthetase
LEKVEPHKMALGKCYRCKTVVEPYLSPQWFVKIAPLAEPAIRAVEDGRIRIIPEGWTNNYLGWMREIKDWCISRQIWWGHQIPAWYCRACHQGKIQPGLQAGSWLIPPEAKPHVAREAPAQCAACGSRDFIRDPDVLDTWFSSALWPFSTLGWPERTPDLQTYYPTSALVTGLDILFFWVARMIMMGLRFTGEVPFRHVYIHALVRDAEGQKMSKSKGNVIDPLSVMEQFGTDALRFTLASMASPGRDIKLAEERIEGYRNFANKIWNAARFILMNLDGERAAGPPATRSFADRWILHRLNRTIHDVNGALESYRFDQAASLAYQFVWHEYCDWYLELIKPAMMDKASAAARETRHTLVESFETLLRLLHPLMPFITEEIWQAIPHEGDSIVTSPYPDPDVTAEWESQDADALFSALERFVSVARTGRSLLNYSPAKTLTLFGTSKNHADNGRLTELRRHLEHLSRGHVTLAGATDWPERVLKLVVEELTVGVLVEGDVDLQKALDRILKQRDEGAKEAARLDGKLASRDFTGKAPPEVVAEHRVRLSTLKGEQAMLAGSADQLRAMIASRAS